MIQKNQGIAFSTFDIDQSLVENEFVLTMNLPGIGYKELKYYVQDGCLYLLGLQSESSEFRKCYYRVLPLPQGVHTDPQILFHNGVATMNFPFPLESPEVPVFNGAEYLKLSGVEGSYGIAAFNYAESIHNGWGDENEDMNPISWGNPSEETPGLNEEEPSRKEEVKTEENESQKENIEEQPNKEFEGKKNQRQAQAVAGFIPKQHEEDTIQEHKGEREPKNPEVSRPGPEKREKHPKKKKSILETIGLKKSKEDIKNKNKQQDEGKKKGYANRIKRQSKKLFGL